MEKLYINTVYFPLVADCSLELFVVTTRNVLVDCSVFSRLLTSERSYKILLETIT